MTLGKKLFLCVDGACVRNGRILLLKRKVEPFKGCWALVGGHVEENESVADALRREFKEETDLDVEVGDFIDARIEETIDRVKVILTYKVTSLGDKIRINAENEDYGWFSDIPLNSVRDYGKLLQEVDDPFA